MFYYKTSFSKKAVFSEKIMKNPFRGRCDHFEERGRLVTKINITFFEGIDVSFFFWDGLPNTVFKFFPQNPHTI